MDYVIFIKCHLNSIFLALLLGFVVFSSEAKNENSEYFASIPIDESLVQDVTYEYELINGLGNQPDCVGTLSLLIPALTDVDAFVVERTLPHTLGSDNLRFMVKSAFSGDTSHLDISNIYWGTYFRVNVIFTDGSRKYSPIYSVNEYIDEEDLALFIKQTHVGNADIDDVEIGIKGKNLYIRTSAFISLSIYDLYGNMLFTGDIDQSMAMPLDNLKSPIIIIKYTNSNDTVTKKILIQ